MKYLQEKSPGLFGGNAMAQYRQNSTRKLRARFRRLAMRWLVKKAKIGQEKHDIKVRSVANV